MCEPPEINTRGTPVKQCTEPLGSLQHNTTPAFDVNLGTQRKIRQRKTINSSRASVQNSDDAKKTYPSQKYQVTRTEQPKTLLLLFCFANRLSPAVTGTSANNAMKKADHRNTRLELGQMGGGGWQAGLCLLLMRDGCRRLRAISDFVIASPAAYARMPVVAVR